MEEVLQAPWRRTGLEPSVCLHEGKGLGAVSAQSTVPLPFLVAATLGPSCTFAQTHPSLLDGDVVVPPEIDAKCRLVPVTQRDKDASQGGLPLSVARPEPPSGSVADFS